MRIILLEYPKSPFEVNGFWTGECFGASVARQGFALDFFLQTTFCC
jgi:hypothetical protein